LLNQVYPNPSIISGAQNRAFRIRYGGLETAAPWQLARIVVAGTSAWKSGKAEDPEIPVMSWENARDKMNSARAFRDLEVNC